MSELFSQTKIIILGVESDNGRKCDNLKPNLFLNRERKRQREEEKETEKERETETEERERERVFEFFEKKPAF